VVTVLEALQASLEKDGAPVPVPKADISAPRPDIHAKP
jgi:hypothetical protein